MAQTQWQAAVGGGIVYTVYYTVNIYNISIANFEQILDKYNLIKQFCAEVNIWVSFVYYLSTTLCIL